MQFDFKIKTTLSSKMVMQLSRDKQKLMTYTGQTLDVLGRADFIIYSREDYTNRPKQVKWVPFRRINTLPPFWTTKANLNYVFSPSFSRYADFDFASNQIVVKRMEDDKVVFKLPSTVFNFNLQSRSSCLENIRHVAARFMMHDENQIRLLNHDNIDFTI